MSFMERHQVALYLASMAVGVACAGLSGWSQVSEQLVPYALGALLWTNFALMPLTGMGAGQYKGLTRTVVLFAALGTPVLVALLVSLFIPEGGPVALATVIVLLAPCVDYVVVFARIAGGEYRGLLAATPYLLGAQIISIPVWTSIYAYIGILDIGVMGEIFPLPAESYLSLAPLIVPLVAAYLAQRWSIRSPQRQQTYERVRTMSDTAMIPLMCLLLALMCSAYTPAVLNQAQLIPPTRRTLPHLRNPRRRRRMVPQQGVGATGTRLCNLQRRHPQRPHHLPRRRALRTTPGTQREPRSEPHGRRRTHPNPHRAAHHGRHDRNLPSKNKDR